MHSISSFQTKIPGLVLNTNGRIQWKGKSYRVKVGDVKVDTKEGLEQLKALLETAFGKIQDNEFKKAQITETHVVVQKGKDEASEYPLTKREQAVYKTAMETFATDDVDLSLTRVSPLKTDPVEALKKSAILASDEVQKAHLYHDRARVKNAEKASSLEELEDGDRKLQESTNKKLQVLHGKHQKALNALSQAYNNATGDEKLELKKAIEAANSHHLQHSLSTNTHNIYHCGSSLYVASRFQLFELEAKPTLTKREKGSLERLEKLKPPVEVKDPEILSPAQATSRYNAHKKVYPNLGGVNRSLCLPGNWLEKRDVVARFSSGDRAYVTVTEVIPIGIPDEDGKLEYNPSGGRTEKTEHPPNLQKTVCYVLDEKGNEIEASKSLAFRCGVFATQESANKAVGAMFNEGHRPIYDDSLLTPSVNVKNVDRRLLKTHAEVAKDAGVSLQSNFGVNIGATKGMLGRKWGWHTATKNYNNEFVSEVNHSLADWLRDVGPKKVQDLAAVYQLTLEMEAIWAKNDFARGEIGNNPAKMPGLARVLMEKLGFSVNDHCKSCKDRGSVVEGYATTVHFEIEMSRQDLVAFLATIDTNKDLTDDDKAALTSGLFSKEEIVEFAKKGSETVQHQVKNKIEEIKDHLTDHPFEQKIVPEKMTFKTDLEGISENKPKREQQTSVVAKAGLMETSIYGKSVLPTDAEMAQSQRLKMNRRAAIRMGLAVTRENTGVTGIKQERGMFAALYSGFDRDFVQSLWNKHQFNELYSALGLRELDKASADKFRAKLKGVKSNEEFLKLAKEIELAKESVILLPPHVKVSE